MSRKPVLVLASFAFLVAIVGLGQVVAYPSIAHVASSTGNASNVGGTVTGGLSGSAGFNSAGQGGTNGYSAIPDTSLPFTVNYGASGSTGLETNTYDQYVDPFIIHGTVGTNIRILPKYTVKSHDETGAITISSATGLQFTPGTGYVDGYKLGSSIAAPGGNTFSSHYIYVKVPSYTLNLRLLPYNITWRDFGTNSPSGSVDIDHVLAADARLLSSYISSGDNCIGTTRWLQDPGEHGSYWSKTAIDYSYCFGVDGIDNTALADSLLTLINSNDAYFTGVKHKDVIYRGYDLLFNQMENTIGQNFIFGSAAPAFTAGEDSELYICGLYGTNTFGLHSGSTVTMFDSSAHTPNRDMSTTDYTHEHSGATESWYSSTYYKGGLSIQNPLSTNFLDKTSASHQLFLKTTRYYELSNGYTPTLYYSILINQRQNDFTIAYMNVTVRPTTLAGKPFDGMFQYGFGATEGSVSWNDLVAADYVASSGSLWIKLDVGSTFSRAASSSLWLRSSTASTNIGHTSYTDNGTSGNIYSYMRPVSINVDNLRYNIIDTFSGTADDKMKFCPASGIEYDITSSGTEWDVTYTTQGYAFASTALGYERFRIKMVKVAGSTVDGYICNFIYTVPSWSLETIPPNYMVDTGFPGNYQERSVPGFRFGLGAYSSRFLQYTIEKMYTKASPIAASMKLTRGVYNTGFVAPGTITGDSWSGGDTRIADCSYTISGIPDLRILTITGTLTFTYEVNTHITIPTIASTASISSPTLEAQPVTFDMIATQEGSAAVTYPHVVIQYKNPSGTTVTSMVMLTRIGVSNEYSTSWNVPALDDVVHPSYPTFTYWYVAQDTWGNWRSSASSVVTINKDYPTMTQEPSSPLSFQLGSTATLTWKVSGHYLSTWKVEARDYTTNALVYSNTGSMVGYSLYTFSMDGNTIGYGHFKVVFTGRNSISTVSPRETPSSVLDLTMYDYPTFASQQSSVDFNEDTGIHVLSWTATDPSPTTYSLTRNGSGVASGSWSSGVAITYNFDTVLANAKYVFVMTVTNVLSKSAVSTSSNVRILPVYPVVELTSTLVDGSIKFANLSTGNYADFDASDYSLTSWAFYYKNHGDVSWIANGTGSLSAPSDSASIPLDCFRWRSSEIDYDCKFAVLDGRSHETDSYFTVDIFISTLKINNIGKQWMNYTDVTRTLAWLTTCADEDGYEVHVTAWNVSEYLFDSGSYTSGTDQELEIDFSSLVINNYTVNVSIFSDSYTHVFHASNVIDLIIYRQPVFTAKPAAVISKAEDTGTLSLTWTWTDDNQYRVIATRNGIVVLDDIDPGYSTKTLTLDTDAVADGWYNYTFIVKDYSGMNRTSKANVSIVAMYPTIARSPSFPSTYTLPLDFIGDYSVSWDLNDTTLAWYNITERVGMSDVLRTRSEVPSSLYHHSFNLAGLSAGSHQFTLWINDSRGHVTTDTFVINAEEIELSVTFVNTSRYLHGTSGHSVNWTVDSNFPGMYVIRIDGTKVAVDFLESTSSFITWNIDGLTFGSHWISLTANTSIPGSSSEMGNITITVYKYPVLSESPVNATYYQDTGGLLLTWKFTVDDPDTYKVYRYHSPGILIASGSWTSGTRIDIITTSTLEVGTYIYSINVTCDSGAFLVSNVSITFAPYVPLILNLSVEYVTHSDEETNVLAIGVSDYHLDSWVLYRVTLDIFGREILTLVDSGSMDNFSGQYNITHDFGKLEVGNYTYRLVLNDTFGNEVSADFSILSEEPLARINFNFAGLLPYILLGLFAIMIPYALSKSKSEYWTDPKKRRNTLLVTYIGMGVIVVVMLSFGISPVQIIDPAAVWQMFVNSLGVYGLIILMVGIAVVSVVAFYFLYRYARGRGIT